MEEESDYSSLIQIQMKSSVGIVFTPYFLWFTFTLSSNFIHAKYMFSFQQGNNFVNFSHVFSSEI